MIGSLRVVLIDHDLLSGSALAADLEGKGCAIKSMAPGESDIEDILAQGANAIVIRAGDHSLAASETARLLKAGEQSRQAPIIVIDDATRDTLDDRHFDGVVDARLPEGSLTSELMARLRSLTRLHVMRSELSRREAVERRYGLTPDSKWVAPVDTDDMQILAVGDFGDQTQQIINLLGDEQPLTHAVEPALAIDELADGRYEAVIVAVTGNADQWLTMCSDIRDNPRLFNLPILLVADPDGFDDPTTPFRRGATDILKAPLDVEILRARISLLIRQQRFRGRMREAYQRSLHVETSDSLTGLYNYGFLHDYLGELVKTTGRDGVPVSVGVFDVKGMARINQRHGYAAGDKLLRQVGSLIGRLVRGEDLTARYGGQSFCVVMPETNAEDASMVLRRIATIVGMTEFGITMDEEPVSAFLRLGCVMLEQGDTAETLLARACAFAV